MIDKPASNNPFTVAVFHFFNKQGKRTSEAVLQVLDKTHLELSQEEQTIYKELIIPMKGYLENAINKEYKFGNQSTYADDLRTYGDTISGQIAQQASNALKEKPTESPLGNRPRMVSRQSMVATEQIYSDVVGCGQANHLSKKKPGRPRKRISAVVLIVLLLLIAVAIILSYVFLNTTKEEIYSHNGLQISLPTDFSVEVIDDISLAKSGHLDKRHNWIRIYSEREHDDFGGIYLTYPFVNPDFHSHDFFYSQYKNVEDTSIGGKRAIICNINPDAPFSQWERSEDELSIYLPDEQLYLAGRNDNKREMIEIAESAICDYGKYENVPEPLKGGHEYLAGTWESEDSINTVRLGYNDEDGMIYGLVCWDDYWMFKGKPDGLILLATDIDYGNVDFKEIGQYDPYIKVTVFDEGEDMLLLLNNLFWCGGRDISNSELFYKKISSDPVYGLPTIDSTITADSSEADDIKQYKQQAITFMDNIVRGASDWGCTYEKCEKMLMGLSIESYEIEGVEYLDENERPSPTGEMANVYLSCIDKTGRSYDVILMFETCTTASNNMYMWKWCIDGTWYKR